MSGVGAALLLVVAACGLSCRVHTAESSGSALELVHREAYLMGTRARLTVYAPGREAGFRELDAALSVLEDTERELSTWQTDSAISSLNRTPIGMAWRANQALCRMFADVYHAQSISNGAFDPAIGALTAAWGIHDEGRVPSTAEIDAVLRRSGLKRLAFDSAGCTLTRRADVTLDVGAFGKGEALDRAGETLRDHSWMIDLGGQVSVGGTMPGGESWQIAVAHPLQRDRVYLEIRMSSGSLSTSGGSERDHVVEGVRVAHHLDPRTGRPVRFSGSVTVWHHRGIVADMLSTALYVMGPEEGIEWAEGRDLSACYLISESGTVRMVATSAFRRLMFRGA